MLRLVVLSALVAVALSVAVNTEQSFPALRFDAEKGDWEFQILRRGRDNKVFAVTRFANETRFESGRSNQKQGVTIPVPDWLQNLINQITAALTPPVAISTPITNLIDSTVELKPTDLTLLVCDSNDDNACGQKDFPGAGSCSGILGINICMCSLPNFVFDMRTGKCKPIGANGLVCSTGTCTANNQCAEQGGVTALAGSTCQSPSANTFKCTCPDTHQFNPSGCNCIKKSTECAKSRNLCNQIDLFAFCQTVVPAAGGLDFQCLCSFGFTPKKGSCVKDLGTLVALKKPKLYLAGKLTGLVGVILGAIFVGLSLKKASSCDVLAEVRAYDEYKDSVNETFDKVMRTFACDPEEFDVDDNELAAY